MNMNVPFVMTKSGINVYLDGKMESIANDHPNYQQITDALLSGEADMAEIESLVNIPKAVAKFSDGHITIDNDEFKYDGTVMHNALTSRILDLLKKQKPIENLVKFMENLMENPSFRAVNELYSFLEACTLPITADGCFLTYKRVNDDYSSIHANPDGTRIDNSVGKVVKMARNLVNEDPNQTCSSGLHVCSFGYLSSFGGARTVVCKVNPKNVVAVPTDYNNQKMRVCEYEVVSEIPNGEELKDKYNTDEYSYDDDEYEENNGSYTAPEPEVASVSKSEPKAGPKLGNWECRDAWGNDVEFYPNMTAGQAKYRFSKDFDVDFIDVRIRKA